MIPRPGRKHVFIYVIFRKIYGPIKENGTRKFRINRELDELCMDNYIITYIKDKRNNWRVHVGKMKINLIPKLTLDSKLHNKNKQIKWNIKMNRPKPCRVAGVGNDSRRKGIRNRKQKIEYIGLA